MGNLVILEQHFAGAILFNLPDFIYSRRNLEINTSIATSRLRFKLHK